jgi:hypothetical protein
MPASKSLVPVYSVAIRVGLVIALCLTHDFRMNWDNAFVVVTCCGLNDQRTAVQFPVGSREFVRSLLLLPNEYRWLYPLGIKQQERESEH